MKFCPHSQIAAGFWFLGGEPFACGPCTRDGSRSKRAFIRSRRSSGGAAKRIGGMGDGPPHAHTNRPHNEINGFRACWPHLPRTPPANRPPNEIIELGPTARNNIFYDPFNTFVLAAVSGLIDTEDDFFPNKEPLHRAFEIVLCVSFAIGTAGEQLRRIVAGIYTVTDIPALGRYCIEQVKEYALAVASFD